MFSLEGESVFGGLDQNMLLMVVVRRKDRGLCIEKCKKCNFFLLFGTVKELKNNQTVSINQSNKTNAESIAHNLTQSNNCDSIVKHKWNRK